MKALINAAVDLCLLRLGPQHMPASSALIALLMLLNLLIGTLMAMLADSGFGMGFLQSLFQLALMLGSLYLVLKWLHKLKRFNQTGSALLLIELLFSLLALPLVSWYQRTTSTESGLLMLVLIFWNIVVIGHILRHAFEVDLNMGIAAAVLYTLVTWNITHLLFSVPS
ncbi:MAG: hypothetical protein PVI92_01040 [Chromatiales bacterium]